MASTGGVTYEATQSDGLVRAVSVKTGRLTTLAGVGIFGTSGDGGPAIQAELDLNEGVCAVAVDNAGNLLVDQNDRIRVVIKRAGNRYGRPRQAGDIYTIAGGGTGALRDGRPATAVSIGFSSGVAVDPAGNVVIADLSGNRILLVAVRSGTFYGVRARAGDIYTIAGDGTAGFSGNRGPARQAELNAPLGVAVDGAGNVLIADSGNHLVRIVPARSGQQFGHPMQAGDIYTVAGDGSREPLGPGGNARHVGLDGPAQVAVDGEGNLLIADGDDRAYGVVAASGGTSPYGGYQMTAGDIYEVAGDGFGLGALGVAVDSAGNIVMGDGSAILRVFAEHSGVFYGQQMTAGSVYAVAGNGQYISAVGGFSGAGRTALTAQVGMPTGIAADARGNLAIAARGFDTVLLTARNSGTFYGQAMTAGHIYAIASDPSLFGLYAIAFDHTGNLVMTTGNQGEVLVRAVRAGTFYGRPMTAGKIYPIGGGGTQSGDGIPAPSAALAYTAGVTVDAAGNVLLADAGTDSRVRCIAVASGTFYGQQMTAGDIYTIAGNGTTGYSGDGGAATSAELTDPTSVALDGHDNVVIADHGNYRVRVVAAHTGTMYGQQMTAGDIYTIGGNGMNANDGDGGSATAAAIAGQWDQSLTIDQSGNVLVAASDKIRAIAAANGTRYGVPMTAGDIYTVAGNGTIGYSGDGGPASTAELTEADSVATGPDGSILLGDVLRIRSVTP